MILVPFKPEKGNMTNMIPNSRHKVHTAQLNAVVAHNVITVFIFLIKGLFALQEPNNVDHF